MTPLEAPTASPNPTTLTWAPAHLRPGTCSKNSHGPRYKRPMVKSASIKHPDKKQISNCQGLQGGAAQARAPFWGKMSWHSHSLMKVLKATASNAQFYVTQILS